MNKPLLLSSPLTSRLLAWRGICALFYLEINQQQNHCRTINRTGFLPIFIFFFFFVEFSHNINIGCRILILHICSGSHSFSLTQACTLQHINFTLAAAVLLCKILWTNLVWYPVAHMAQKRNHRCFLRAASRRCWRRKSTRGEETERHGAVRRRCAI